MSRQPSNARVKKFRAGKSKIDFYPSPEAKAIIASRKNEGESLTRAVNRLLITGGGATGKNEENF